MPELGRFWADAASIGQEPAQFWHITACLQGQVSFMFILPNAKIYIQDMQKMCCAVAAIISGYVILAKLFI